MYVSAVRCGMRYASMWDWLVAATIVVVDLSSAEPASKQPSSNNAERRKLNVNLAGILVKTPDRCKNGARIKFCTPLFISNFHLECFGDFFSLPISTRTMIRETRSVGGWIYGRLRAHCVGVLPFDPASPIGEKKTTAASAAEKE